MQRSWPVLSRHLSELIPPGLHDGPSEGPDPPEATSSKQQATGTLTSPLLLVAYCLLLGTSQAEDVHRCGGGLAAHHAPAVLAEADFRAFDLPIARLTAELEEDLVDLGHSGSAHRVPLRQQAAAGVHRHPASQLRHPLVDEAAALALRAEAQVFVDEDLGRGRGV